MAGGNRVSKDALLGFAVVYFQTLAAIAFASGACALPVSLVGLRSPPADGPRRNLVFDPGSGQVRRSYRPWRGDTLVVRVAPAGVSGCGASVSTSQPIVSAELVVSRRGVQETLSLTDRTVSELRLSTVVPSDAPPFVDIKTESRSDIRLELYPFDGAINWGDYRTALEGTCRRFGLMLDIVPVERAFAQPGDEIVVTRQSLISDAFSMDAANRAAEQRRRSLQGPASPAPPAGGTADTTAEAPTPKRLAGVAGGGTREVERFELSVGPDGAVDLPSITRLSAFEIYASGGGGLVAPRAYTNALLAPANSRLVVTRLPLTILAACLSIAEVAPSQEGCAGLDARYAPTDGDGGARREISYTIEPGRRSWFLVDRQGQRVTFPYSYGTTVFDAVRAAHRGWSGRELPCSRHSFLTVIPRAESGEPPFFAALGASNEMARVLLKPGDTVHLTARKPHRAMPEGRAE